MTENLKQTKKCNKEHSLESHNKLNKILSTEEDFEYWQDKVLTLSLNKTKEEFEYNKKLAQSQSILTESIQQKNVLEAKLSQLQEELSLLRAEESAKEDTSLKIKEEIEFFEKQNESLYADCMQRYSHISDLTHKPEALLSHLARFDEDSLKSLCIRLNKLVEEKNHQYHMFKMQQQQQFYNQMMMNGGQGFFINPVGVMGAPHNYSQPYQNPQQNEEGGSES